MNSEKLLMYKETSDDSIRKEIIEKFKRFAFTLNAMLINKNQPLGDLVIRNLIPADELDECFDIEIHNNFKIQVGIYTGNPPQLKTYIISLELLNDVVWQTELEKFYKNLIKNEDASQKYEYKIY